MKKFKNALRYWFAITSLLSFMGGWIIFAHSPKPVQPTTVVSSAPLLNLPPIQAFGSTTNNGVVLSRPSSGFPVLRTGGS